MTKTFSIACAVMVLAAACGGSSPTNPGLEEVGCTNSMNPGLVITTLDVATGDTVRTKGVVHVQDAAYTETAIALPPLYYGAYERPGTYSITVEVPGYREWTATGVVLGRDKYGCHVETVRLSAHLIR